MRGENDFAASIKQAFLVEGAASLSESDFEGFTTHCTIT